VRLRNFFSRRHAPAAPEPGPVVVDAPREREPLTPEQLADLKEAWAELSQAAEETGVRNFRACTRDGSSWEDDPEAVRRMAATIRNLPGLDAVTSREQGR
jgi:hypothetical protein